MSLAFARDGKQIIGPSFVGAHVWDIASGEIVDTYGAAEGTVEREHRHRDRPPRARALHFGRRDRHGLGPRGRQPARARVPHDRRLRAVPAPRTAWSCRSAQSGAGGQPHRREDRAAGSAQRAVRRHPARARRDDARPRLPAFLARRAPAGDRRQQRDRDDLGRADADDRAAVALRRARHGGGGVAGRDAARRPAAGAGGRRTRTWRCAPCATGRTLYTRTMRFGRGRAGVHRRRARARGLRVLRRRARPSAAGTRDRARCASGARWPRRKPALRDLAARRHAGGRHRRRAGPVVGRAHRPVARGRRRRSLSAEVARARVLARRAAARRWPPTASCSGTSTRASASAAASPREEGWLPDIAFEPNGRLLIFQLAATIEWPTDRPTLQRFACQIAGRDLTPEEWRELLPNRPYRRVCLG